MQALYYLIFFALSEKKATDCDHGNESSLRGSSRARIRRKDMRSPPASVTSGQSLNFGAIEDLQKKTQVLSLKLDQI